MIPSTTKETTNPSGVERDREHQIERAVPSRLEPGEEAREPTQGGDGTPERCGPREVCRPQDGQRPEEDERADPKGAQHLAGGTQVEVDQRHLN